MSSELITEWKYRIVYDDGIADDWHTYAGDTYELTVYPQLGRKVRRFEIVRELASV